jgi:cyclic beta-1,2-glucan synthetase
MRSKAERVHSNPLLRLLSAEYSMPLRGESYGQERLQEHARQWARGFRAAVGSTRKGERQFLERGRQNAIWLSRAYERLRIKAPSPDGDGAVVEWFLDNYSVVEEQIREIKEDLPLPYFRQLPKSQLGVPRVYLLAEEWIVHTDSALEEQALYGYLQAFHDVEELSIGESWAFPIMLRLALVENLRRLVEQHEVRCEEKSLLREILPTTEPRELLEIPASLVEQRPACILEILANLGQAGDTGADQFLQFEQHLDRLGFSLERLSHLVHQTQAANQVSTGNVITSMRLVSSVDWVACFEATNATEKVLREDPAGVYGQMDAQTRDRYRHVVERLAKRSPLSEKEIAAKAIFLASRVVDDGGPDYQQHVGYYLIDEGEKRLKNSIQIRPDILGNLLPTTAGSLFVGYIGGIGLLTLGLSAFILWMVVGHRPLDFAFWIMITLLLVPASEMAWEILNFFTSRIRAPRRLPKLDFQDGIPPSQRTLVVVPALLSSERELKALTRRLEEHFLANRDEALRFALLTDFADAAQETLPTDARILEEAEQEIQRLNQRYPAADGDRFALFHRRRRWNPREGVWMGWERKRGKLMDLGDLLLTGSRPFDWIFGDWRAWLKGDGKANFKYVITLDADTRLPLGTAHKLVGAMSHPLNRARVNDRGVITAGYAVLQPRVGIDFKSANQSVYARLFAQQPGIDPYSSAASDTYQDLFGEGSFTGKGIYDLEAFHFAVQDAFPDNAILSHDLIEGCHSRVGLLNDVELIDGYPARYDADLRRLHRWVRGDWQILPWLLPWVPTRQGYRPNPLSALSRWKVLDNLRRSLVAPVLLLVVIGGWFLYPEFAALFSILAFTVYALPLVFELLSLVTDGLQVGPSIVIRRDRSQSVKRTFLRACVLLATLPHRAWTMVDAVARTLYRIGISRRKLLEWEPAAVTERRLRGSRWWHPWEIWFGPLLALILVVVLPRNSLAAASPALIAWILAPFVVYRISAVRETKKKTETLSTDEQSWLLTRARLTWRYFEEFVSEADHWLPPDNVQEIPRQLVAHRVSPTNEGLYLVSSLVARDFGFITLYDLVNLWERNLDSWRSLEQFNGHFYNWYDTTNLRPLAPRYVSTVDSGNLGVCLVTLTQGISELRSAPVLSPGLWEELVSEHQKQGLPAQKWTSGMAELSPQPPGLLMLDSFRKAASDASVWDDWNCWCSALRLLDAWQTDPIETGERNRIVDGLKQDARRLYSWLPDALELSKLFATSSMDLERKVDPQSFHPNSNLEDPKILSVMHGAWSQIEQILLSAKSLEKIASISEQCNSHFTNLFAAKTDSKEGIGDEYDFRRRCEQVKKAVDQAAHEAKNLLVRLEKISQIVHEMLEGMEYRFLYNSRRQLFTIGFNVDSGEADRAHYDMFMSEARLATYFAISKGDVDQRAWFKMSRPVTNIANEMGLLSWGGTIFEYLMPALFHHTYEGSLLASSYAMAVAHQQAYGKSKRLPWGISESAFAAQSANGDYQYRSFGVPGIGLKRGLANDYVVAPYASCLALDFAPRAVYENLREIESQDGVGRYGFYDALDYTPERVTAKLPRVPVRCYMSHHQGMILTAIANHLLDGTIRRRFHAHPLSRAAELLLQESEPTIAVVLAPPSPEPVADSSSVHGLEWVSRRIVEYQTDVPRTHLLSNGEYSLMVTNAGSGYSSWRRMGVTRWQPDITRDHWGQYIYIRDHESEQFWSATYQPTRIPPDSYEVTYSIDKAEFVRRDGDLESHLEITISPEEPVELRILKITNHGSQTRELDVTSYGEMVLTNRSADIAHPAFQKLFVETEFAADNKAILAKRRSRSAAENPTWLAHVVAGSPNVDLGVEFETSRDRFIGRLGSCEKPAGMRFNEPLSGSSGCVLDPVFAIRSKMTLLPGESAVVTFCTGVGESRAEVMRIAERYHDLRNVQRGFEISWAYHQTALKHLGITPAQSHLFQRLASGLLYPDRSRRGSRDLAGHSRVSQPDLWPFGISGDLPLLVARIRDQGGMQLVRELVLAHAFWHNHGFDVEMAIINDHPASYVDAVQEELQEILNTSTMRLGVHNSKILLLRSTMMSATQLSALESVAHVVLVSDHRTLEDQLDQPSNVFPAGVGRTVRQRAGEVSTPARSEVRTELPLWNGYGGFGHASNEYQIHLTAGQTTPRPWCNVIANPSFGCIVSESGGGYTWMKNSREYKFSSWENDPVSDAPSEHLYVFDRTTQELWRPLENSERGSGESREICHGFGYTRVRATRGDLTCTTMISIATSDAIKFMSVEIHNHGEVVRELAVNYAVEWVLGTHRNLTQFHLATDFDPDSAAILATNPFRPAFAECVAFLKALGPEPSWTTNRGKFLGRNGSWDFPAGIEAPLLSHNSDVHCDPCGVVQSCIRLNPGERQEVIFLLGGADSRDQARTLVEAYSTVDAVHMEIRRHEDSWQKTLGTMQLTSPWPDLDFLFNGWLMYQVISCRLWARCGLYQAGGAYGFRDQLQDVMAVAYSRPELAREHILRAAARQFEEGDVQHWWHPPGGEGTRTRYSDDLLWLPFVVTHYVRVTGDVGILDELIPFLRSAALGPSEHDRYETPQVSSETATLYEHCRRAIQRGSMLGSHGLPLMRGGDWNDGMDQVGAAERGESMWLGWFLIVVLNEFIPLMEERGATSEAIPFKTLLTDLRTNMELHAWDGAWYRRAYFDDGSPLGSRENSECAIDSLPQSWGVFASADKQRTRKAMDSVWSKLVFEDPQLVLLFSPPFNQGSLNPGYIRGYPPGIRENGGQYTHGAVWVAKAFAEMGDAERAGKLLEMLLPTRHAADKAMADIYQVEPYVVAADIYSHPEHLGKGGWTWYTGSAAWLYRFIVESILGIHLRGNRLTVRPCLPIDWTGYGMTLHHQGTEFRIQVSQDDELQDSTSEFFLDGMEFGEDGIEMPNDGQSHAIQVKIGRSTQPAPASTSVGS